MQYAVTFTLSPFFKKRFPTALKQFDELHKVIPEIFRLWNKSIIIELTRKYDCHLHGIVDINYEFLENNIINLQINYYMI